MVNFEPPSLSVHYKMLSIKSNYNIFHIHLYAANSRPITCKGGEPSRVANPAWVTLEYLVSEKFKYPSETVKYIDYFGTN